jgi:predicted histone-like DNA-binding protein
MSIQYELSLNKLTTPPSYTPRVRPRATIGLDQIAQRIADASTLSPADIHATLVAFTELIESELLAGNWVALEGIGIITTSLSGRIAGPTDPLPEDSKVEIGFRADNRLRKNLRANADRERIDPSDQAPLLLALNLKVGSVLPDIAPTNVLELEGDRLKINESELDEGVFLVPPGAAALRVVNYLSNGDKKLLFALPTGLASGEAYTLQVRNRRTRSIVLRTTTWPTLLVGTV